MIRVYSGGIMCEDVPYVYCVKVRKKGQRKPKWMDSGGMWASCDFKYPDKTTEVRRFFLIWCAN